MALTKCFGLSLVVVCMLLVAACSTTPPSNISNSCAIFDEKDDWYSAAKDSAEKWGVPIHVQLAIIHQESSFKYDAKPPKNYLLGFIPWGRKSTAFGYAQVKDSTWDWYIDKTGNWGADRDEFDDAVDFIGWYGTMSYKTLGISKWDAYNQYLAYHEGHGGFKRKTYNRKPWLIKVARKVKNNSLNYARQLRQCQGRLEDSGWF